MKKFVSFFLFATIVILALIARTTADAQAIDRPGRGMGRFPGHSRIYMARPVGPFYHRHYMYGFRWHPRPMRLRRYRW